MTLTMIQDQSFLITQGEISKLLGCCPATISKWSKDGVNGFPPPLRIGPNQSTATKMWRRSDISSWLEGLQGVRNVPFVGSTPKKKRK